jgi:hypothetical protein
MLECTRSQTVFEQQCPQLIWMCSFIDYLSLKNIAFNWSDSSFDYLCLPLANLNIVCFPSHGPLYCPRLLNFSRSVEKFWCHFYKGFYKFDRCSSCLIVFCCYGINSHFSKIMYIQSLNVEMKSERCQFWKVFLKINLLWSNTHYMSFNTYSPLIVLYFENRNWSVIKLK